MCLNAYDKNNLPVNTNLYGADENYPHRRIEIMYRPCKPRIWDNEHSYLVEDECFISDDDQATKLDKLRLIKEWIGQPDL